MPENIEYTILVVDYLLSTQSKNLNVATAEPKFQKSSLALMLKKLSYY